MERFGRFHRTLEPGLAILLPFVDQIRYVQSLKETAIEIPSQSAITEGGWLRGCVVAWLAEWLRGWLTLFIVSSRR